MSKAVKKAPKKVANKAVATKASLEKELAKIKDQAKKKALVTVEMMMAKRDELIEEAIAQAAMKFEKLFGTLTAAKADKASAKKAPAKKVAAKKAPAKTAAKAPAKKAPAKKGVAKKGGKKKAK